MSISTRQLKLLWTAKGQVGLSDTAFRAALVHLTGCTSTKELDQEGFTLMMGFMEWRGFKPLDHGADYGERPGMASFAQLELIRVLWREYTRNKAGDAALCMWLRNKWHVDSLRFVSKSQAQKIITALKAMKARAAA